MSQQDAVAIFAEISSGRVDGLKSMLGTLSERGGRASVIPFAKLPRLHFGQVAVFDAATCRDGRVLPAYLVLVTYIDAPAAAHLDDLSSICGEGLDAVLAHCAGYPAAPERSPATRKRFLEARLVKPAAVHINGRGRTVQQVRQEDMLRREISAWLDGADCSGLTPAAIKARIAEFVRGRPDLAWALQLPERPSLGWRLMDWLHAGIYLTLAIVLLPLVLLALPVFIAVLRYHEKRDMPDTSSASPLMIRTFREDVDYWAHNPFMVVGLLKQGWFRRFTTKLMLGVANYSTRHIYNRGALSGLNTIHFASWIPFDEGRRMCFTSNYDGSVENYMNDFIDKAAWGLNAVFSAGEGFPKTAYLVAGGITDEKAYKRFLPTRFVATREWFSAYPHLTAQNIANSAAIRRGLSMAMTDEQARAWLKRFGSGSQTRSSGRVARFLDGLPWDRICRRSN